MVADAIDRQTENLRSSVHDAWEWAGVTEYIESVRFRLSSVPSIVLLALWIEAYGLRSEVLPMRYAFTIPAIRALRTSDLPVMIPDLFLLLTGAFWAPFSLWLLTSLLLPSTVAFFFNLSLRAKTMSATRARHGELDVQIDPLAFCVAKALITWLIYARGAEFGGLFSEETVEKVNGSVPGGYWGVMIGAGIGALTSIYEAVLRKR